MKTKWMFQCAGCLVWVPFSARAIAQLSMRPGESMIYTCRECGKQTRVTALDLACAKDRADAA